MQHPYLCEWEILEKLPTLSDIFSSFETMSAYILREFTCKPKLLILFPLKNIISLIYFYTFHHIVIWNMLKFQKQPPEVYYVKRCS